MQPPFEQWRSLLGLFFLCQTTLLLSHCSHIISTVLYSYVLFKHDLDLAMPKGEFTEWVLLHLQIYSQTLEAELSWWYVSTGCANKVACSWVKNMEDALQAFFSLAKGSLQHLWCRVVRIHRNSWLILFEGCFPVHCSDPLISVQACQLEESLTLKNHCFDWTWII